MNRLFLFSLFFIVTPLLPAQDYKNSSLTPEQRADDLLRRMTLDEKLAQIRHIHSWDIFDGQELDTDKLSRFVRGLPWGFVEGFPLTGESCHRHMRRIQQYMVDSTRLGIPVFTVAEALHGSVHEGSAIYPQNIALGATFHPELARLRARRIAGDLHYQGIRQILAPCVDVVRDLRWGRVEECYGEDPFLAALMACEEVRGYLENGISPMLKHFGPHGNPQGGLNLASVNCGVGELHDIYLQPFRRVITTMPIQAVMSAYNAWNRCPNSSSRYLMTDVLRRRWGFQGYVYADWGSIDMLHTFQHTASGPAEAAFQALSAGLDVEASSECYPKLLPLIRAGKVDEALVDTAVRRVLLAKFRMGLFEDPYGDRHPSARGMRTPQDVEASLRISRESIVLLKNEDALLPLDTVRLRTLAVIGPNAGQVQFGDYSWSRSTKDGVTPLEGIRRMASGWGMQVLYEPGCSLLGQDTEGIAAAVQTVRRADAAVVFCGSASASLARDYKEVNCGEGFDLSDLSLSGRQHDLIRAVQATGKPVVLVLVTGKPFAIPWEKEHVPAIIVQWYGGEQAGQAIAEVLFGRVNPSGHLPVSFPRSAGHLPAYYNHLSTDRGFYCQPGSTEKAGRDYVFSSPDPLWAFGHGLSYTEFSYSDLSVEVAGDAVERDSVRVFVTVRNTDLRSGQAVPQLYVRDLVSSVVMPVQQLKAFSKVWLEPGQESRVNLSVALSDLMLTGENGETRFEPGDFEFRLGDASDHILLRDTVALGEPFFFFALGEKMAIDKAVAPGGAGRLGVVSGTVRDVQAMPVAQVEVYSQSLLRVVARTDPNGAYRAEVPSDDLLIFRKRGYLDAEFPVDGQSALHVKLRYGSD